jgi:hypothetical protein
MLSYAYAAYANIPPEYVFVHSTLLLIKKQNPQKARYLFILKCSHAATKVGMCGGTVHISIINISFTYLYFKQSKSQHTSKLLI